MARYSAGEKWHLHEEDLVAAATVEQEERQEGHPWSGPIQDWLNANPHARKGVTTATILRDALFKHTDTWTKQDETNVGRCMKKLGWKKHQLRNPGAKGGREYQYHLPE